MVNNPVAFIDSLWTKPFMNLSRIRFSVSVHQSYRVDIGSVQFIQLYNVLSTKLDNIWIIDHTRTLYMLLSTHSFRYQHRDDFKTTLLFSLHTRQLCYQLHPLSGRLPVCLSLNSSPGLLGDNPQQWLRLFCKLSSKLRSIERENPFVNFENYKVFYACLFNCMHIMGLIKVWFLLLETILAIILLSRIRRSHGCV